MTDDNTLFQYDIKEVRNDFPILRKTVFGKPLVYLDNAATTQKPESVIESLTRFYSEENANIHRGIHYLSEQATQRYEAGRSKLQKMINARTSKEIVFTRGATEAINLVAQTYGKQFLKEGDEVILTHMEHHANIVPWQMLRDQIGIKLQIAPINDRGELELNGLAKLFNQRTRLLATVHVSNVLGTVNPIKEMIQMAHACRVPVLIDGAQAVPHMPIDVQELDCEFYVFSGHKMFGPTGVGVLYGKFDLLERMPPYQGGGDMIQAVHFERTVFNSVPFKFEAGTPNIAGVIGLGAAADYITKIGLNNIMHYEQDLLKYATQELNQLPGLRIIGTAENKASVVSFTLGEIHPHDIGTILDRNGIAVRAGHHCAMPLMERFGVPATARASFALYNTKREVDVLVQSLKHVQEVFH